MDIFKKAAKRKLKFNTEIGAITTEDLFDIPLSLSAIRHPATSLDIIARGLSKSIKDQSDESFVGESKVDADLQLRFDIVKSVIESKISDQKKAEKSLATKERNQKILEIMSRKKDAELEGKSLEDLQELLKES